MHINDARDSYTARIQYRMMSAGNTITRSGNTPELISPEPIITPAAGPDSLTEVTIDERWRPLLEEVCILKEALDHATRLGITHENSEWIESVFTAHGLNPMHFAEVSFSHGPQMPSDFMDILLGSWFDQHRLASHKGELVVPNASLPAWATVGWLRKPKYRKTLNLPHDQLIAAVQRTYSQSAETMGFYGTPFFLAHEGKNRTQLHRLANAARLSKLNMRTAPPFREFTLRPVPFVSWGVALEHPERPTEILPFGALSKRLLLALGAGWNERPYAKGIQALRETCAARGLVAPSWKEFSRMPKNDHAIRLLLIRGQSPTDC